MIKDENTMSDRGKYERAKVGLTSDRGGNHDDELAESIGGRGSWFEEG